MKDDIQGSRVEIPVPNDVYVGLLDHLRKHDMDCGPAALVASIVQKYLDDDMANRPRLSSKVKESTLAWSNDWIVFGAPPAVAEGKAPGFGKNPGKQQSNDWCIGCGCPSEDLLSS